MPPNLEVGGSKFAEFVLGDVLLVLHLRDGGVIFVILLIYALLHVDEPKHFVHHGGMIHCRLAPSQLLKILKS